LAAHWEFQRGLVGLLLTAEAFLGSRWKAVAKTEAYAWVDSLCLRQVSTKALPELVAAPHLAGIPTLDLGRNNLGDQGVKVLTAAPQLTGLRTLILGSNGLGPASARALAASRSFASLTALDLGTYVVYDEIPRDFPLNLLNPENAVEFNQIGDEGVQALLSSPHLTHLTTLRLRGNAIGPVGAQALSASPHLACLTTLDLGMNYLGEEE
jgi:hypothetical protein